jgi:hypothetical protein
MSTATKSAREALPTVSAPLKSSTPDPHAALKSSLRSLAARGMSFKAACSHLGVDHAAAAQKCDPTECGFETDSEEQEEIEKSAKLLNRALVLRKSGFNDRQICSVLNVTESNLRSSGFPTSTTLAKGKAKARIPLTNFLGKAASTLRTQRPINRNWEATMRSDATPTRGVCKNTNIPATKAALSIRDRSDEGATAHQGSDTTGPGLSDQANRVNRMTVPQRQRNLSASMVFQAGPGEGQGYSDIISAADPAEKSLYKSVRLPETGRYSYDELLKHVENAIDGVAMFAEKMPLGKAIENVSLSLPLEIRAALVKRLHLQGKAIPNSLVYCLG